ncbi:DUF3421 domain-containing protein [Nostoc cf. edaphicum LEGE 07299]|uniref:DUF3421 domain-containing protein n=1 Tax=Nostoc cf. edaphicum LEGE 07299 TaxID=2777974 RepID=A0ABR9U0E1_9NOSO|nr:DUF3421 domain-containing protein [Nostoc edaphicum]MBE9106141.1 DUF3421 domain-containing protein [Nostoc cf. edaphicum LEGE 07299]
MQFKHLAKNLIKFNLNTTLLAVGIAVSIGVPALAGVLWAKGRPGTLPRNAVEGGTQNRAKLYVCQAIHDKEYTPGKLAAPNFKYCYIPWGGKEYRKTTFRVLTGNNWKWVNFSGKLPNYPVWGGNENNGKYDLYPCRAILNTGYAPGKYYPPNKTCYVSYGGLEYQYKNFFQILTAR